MSSWCTFTLGDRRFGVEAELVKEVAPVSPVTPVPHAPAAVRGYVNLRGLLYLVIDLKRLLRLEPTSLTADTRMVLFKSALGDPFGVMVDRIGDMVDLSPEQLFSMTAAGETESDLKDMGLVLGVGALPGTLLILLDGRQFVPSLRGCE